MRQDFQLIDLIAKIFTKSLEVGRLKIEQLFSYPLSWKAMRELQGFRGGESALRGAFQAPLYFFLQQIVSSPLQRRRLRRLSDFKISLFKVIGRDRLLDRRVRKVFLFPSVSFASALLILCICLRFYRGKKVRSRNGRADRGAARPTRGFEPSPQAAERIRCNSAFK